MSHPPIDGHSEEFDELAGLYALRVLEGDELARFEVHSAACERCQLMVRLDGEALARVALVAPAMDPSPDFKARLMRRAAQELAAAATGQPAPSEPVEEPPLIGRPIAEPTQLRPRPTIVVRFWRRSPWMSALAAVFVVAIVTAGAFTYENQTVATYELTGSVPGSARVVVRRSGAAELEMSGLPNPGPGSIYEAWIITAGKPVAAGIATTGDAKLALSGTLRGTTVAITKEPGVQPQPTSAPILATEVQS
ncbi:MAG TPA: anti-sigma factor [Chloroflexota bacterium]|nr:anti-sigma factor [Chloroflexota bacterium]